MFLLVPAYPGCPGQTAVKWLLLPANAHVLHGSSLHILTAAIFQALVFPVMLTPAEHMTNTGDYEVSDLASHHMQQLTTVDQPGKLVPVL